MKQFCVYILRCCDGTLYVGVTSNLRERIERHQLGYFPDCYTASRLPFQLVFIRYFPTADQAFHFEKQLKNWSRKKKEALISGNVSELKALASCRNESHHSNRKVD